MASWQIQTGGDDWWDGDERAEWFCARLTAVVRAELLKLKIPLNDEALERLVGWFASQPKRYSQYLATKVYTPGHWNTLMAVNEKRVADDLVAALRAVRMALEGEEEQAHYPTIDAWLSALHRGELFKPVHREGWARDYLRDMTPTEFKRTRRRRMRTWPYLCRQCGAEFRGRPGRALVCPQCFAWRRDARRGSRSKGRA